MSSSNTTNPAVNTDPAGNTNQASNTNPGPTNPTSGGFLTKELLEGETGEEVGKWAHFPFMWSHRFLTERELLQIALDYLDRHRHTWQLTPTPDLFYVQSLPCLSLQVRSHLDLPLKGPVEATHDFLDRWVQDLQRGKKIPFKKRELFFPTRAHPYQGIYYSTEWLED